MNQDFKFKEEIVNEDILWDEIYKIAGLTKLNLLPRNNEAFLIMNYMVVRKH